MRTKLAAVGLTMFLAGGAFGGLVVSATEQTPKPASATTATEHAALPIDCREALAVAADGLSSAEAGLARTRSMSGSAPGPGGAQAVSSGVAGALGQAEGEVQSKFQRFNQAKVACESAAGVARSSDGK